MKKKRLDELIFQDKFSTLYKLLIEESEQESK